MKTRIVIFSFLFLGCADKEPPDDGIPDRGIATVGDSGSNPTSPTPTSCCRECMTGKPCGNSCIAKSATCQSPPGCACSTREIEAENALLLEVEDTDTD